MKRMVFRSVANLTDHEHVEVFWLAGFQCTENNEWKVRVIYRNKRTGELVPVLEPIGMLPMLKLGIWFDHGVLKTDGLPGDWVETIVPNVGEPEVITSAELPFELYGLPPGKAGNQRLLRYRTGTGDVLIPAIELVRALFVSNRALALALMRPSGLEQLIAPMEPGHRDTATLKFTKEMPSSAIGRNLAMDVAWIALEEHARRAWDSVRRLSQGQSYVLLDPPPIQNSVWTFRGVQHEDQWLVLELRYVGGRQAPFNSLEYSHPKFRKAVQVAEESGRHAAAQNSSRPSKKASATNDYDVDGGEEGSTSYGGAKVVGMTNRNAVFTTNVKVVKLEQEATGHKQNNGQKHRSPAAKESRSIPVTAGERAGKARLPPLEFKALAPAPFARMGDLEALDETIRHMRDLLPDVEFSMGLVELTQGRAAASVGSSARVAMVVTIRPPLKPPAVLIDVERTGIAALSIMSMQFVDVVLEDLQKRAIQMMLDGWVKSGGCWASEVEEQLVGTCRCLRLPKLLVPRDQFTALAKGWAGRLVQKLGLA